jgi:hypothetical protein
MQGMGHVPSRILGEVRHVDSPVCLDLTFGYILLPQVGLCIYQPSLQVYV